MAGFVIGNNKLSSSIKVLRKNLYLSDRIIRNIDNRIANKDPNISKSIFSTLDHNTATYIRNTNNWAYDIDLTSISVWNSESGGAKGGVLISPRHMMVAAHYSIPVGQTVRFVTKDNTVITRTITALANHPDYQPYYPDICIELLDSDVPSSISHVKLLPSNFSNKVIIEDGSLNIVNIRHPALCLNQTKQAIIKDWSGNSFLIHTGGPGPNYMYPVSVFISPTDAKRVGYNQSIIAGDSGSPIFFIIDGEPVLAGLWLTPVNATWINNVINDINPIMNSLGGGYSISTINLNNFTDVI